MRTAYLLTLMMRQDYQSDRPCLMLLFRTAIGYVGFASFNVEKENALIYFLHQQFCLGLLFVCVKKIILWL